MRFFVILPIIIILPLVAQAEATDKPLKDQQPAIVSDAFPTEMDQTDNLPDDHLKAKSLFEEGLEKLANKRWSEAEALFRSSVEIVKRPNGLFNLALCLMYLGRVRESLDLISELTESADGLNDVELQERVGQLLKRLQATLGSVELNVFPASARITVDEDVIEGSGTKRELKLDPGKHLMVVSARGFTDSHIEVQVESGGDLKLTVFLTPKSAGEAGEVDGTELTDKIRDVPPPLEQQSEANQRSTESDYSLGPWILGGVGVALLVATTITTVAAIDTESEIDRICPGRSACQEEDREQLDSIVARKNRLFTVSNLLLGLGMGSIGVAVAWWLLENLKGNAQEKRSVGLKNSGTEVTLRGEF